MSEDTFDTKSLQEIAQKNLELVQQILGVETHNNFADGGVFGDAQTPTSRKSKTTDGVPPSECQRVKTDENELAHVDAHSIQPNKDITASELTQQKHYLIEQKHYLTTKYAENKLLFAQSRKKFLNRPKRRKRVRI